MPGATRRTARLVLVKHGLPVFEMSRPPREWQLSVEGELQSTRLAGRLGSFAPLRLVVSPEPKARSTGNVIALFVAAHNAIDAFELWRNLECASFVVLDLPSFSLREVVHDAP